MAKLNTEWYLNLPYKHERGDVYVIRFEVDHYDAKEMEAVIEIARLMIGKEKLAWMADRGYELKVFAYPNQSSFQVEFYFTLNLTPEQTTEYHLYWTQGT